MKTLSIIICLLYTTNSYCFDTLSLKTGLQGIKTDAYGTTIYQYVNLPAELGAYVLQIKDLPIQLEEQNLSVEEEEGLQLLKLEWVKQLPNQNNVLDHQLFDQMLELKSQLKALDHEEGETLKFKKELLHKMVDQKDINSVKSLYKEKDIGYKKERMKIYHELQMIQNKLTGFSNLYAEPKNDSQGTLFLSVVKYHLDAKILKFKYFLAHPEPGQTKAGQAAHNVQKDSQLVKGRVIEASNRVPLIFALVEVYEDRELIQSIYTNEMGIFKTKLATNKEYSFVIVQEGYKDRKVKKFNARPSQEVNYRTYTLKEKDPMSLTEFASYAIQVVSLIALNW